MACKLITDATFPGLQSRLLEDLRRAGRADALAPKWVVVPSATLANHLRTELSRGSESEAFANVRVVNLPRFAQRLCVSISKTTTTPWNALLDLLLWALVEDLTQESPLAPLKTISGGPGMLRAAFVDFAEGGFGPAELEKVEELANEPELAPRDGELLRLYARWVQLLQKRQVVWAPLALQRLSQRRRIGHPAPRALLDWLALGFGSHQEPRLPPAERPASFANVCTFFAWRACLWRDAYDTFRLGPSYSSRQFFPPGSGMKTPGT